jgi:hypothetical protein
MNLLVLILQAIIIVISINSGLTLPATEKHLTKREVSKCKPDDLVFYEECKADDILFGELLCDIVGYAMKFCNLSASNATPNSNNLNSYVEDSNKLQKVLGGADPRYVYREYSNFHSVDQLYNMILRDIPMETKYVPQSFKNTIHDAANGAFGYLHTTAEDIGTLFSREAYKEFPATDYAIIKIFKQGNSLYIIPSYIYVRGSKKEKRTLWMNEVWRNAKLDYRQTKFMLTKFDIQAIVKKIENSSAFG